MSIFTLWTEEEQKKFRNLTLKIQCERLDVQVKTFTASGLSMKNRQIAGVGTASGVRIEDFVLACLRDTGWEGDATEGSLFDFTHDALTSIFREIGFKYTTQLKIHDNPIHPSKIAPSHRKHIATAVDTLTLDRIIQAHRNCLWHTARGHHRRISDQALGAGFQRLSRQFLTKFAETEVLGIGSTFPDLTVYKEDQIKLIEVKSKRDRLTLLQVDWILFVQPYLEIPFEVWLVDQTK